VDRQTHIFSIPSDRLVDLASHADPSAGCREIMTLHLHTGPVSSLSPSLDYSNVLTSSWDGLLGVFKLPTREEPLEERHEVGPEPGSYLTGVDRRSKKRRLNVKDTTAIETPNGEQANGLPAANSGGYRKSPEMVLRGHNGRIGGSIWDKEQAGTVWSAGWDGSVRGWAVESGGCEVVKVSCQSFRWLRGEGKGVSAEKHLAYGFLTARTARASGAVHRSDGWDEKFGDGSHGPGRMSLGC
jgi:ribosome biogenesis protein YTM1